MKSSARETDDALFIDVPLLVLEQVSASLRSRPQERVDRGGAAPLQVIAVFLHQIPEALGVTLFHPLNPEAVAACNLFHLAEAGLGLERIAIAAAHVRHIDPQDPQQMVALLGG